MWIDRREDGGLGRLGRGGGYHRADVHGGCAMILAGIDEAGYGPVLGPLVVGCCAFELSGADAPADVLAPLPCLWKALRKCVSKKRTKSGTKLHVNDSKLVYSPSNGLKELERSVLALASCAWRDWDGSQ